MLIERKTQSSSEISTASLPDIIFLLLVFFMVVTVMKTFDAPQIDMPYAKEIEKLENRRNTAFIWARKTHKLNEFIKETKDLNINIKTCHSPEEVVEQSEILVTATPSKSPIIKNEWLKKGLHITAMGSDAEQKNELDPLIIKNCDLYIPDSLSQTKILGELHHAIKYNLVSSNKHYNELGNVILDPSLGRKSKEDITVCDLTGTGIQDTAIARETHEIAINLKLGTYY